MDMNYDAVFHPLLPPLPSIPHADYRDFLSVTVNVPTTCDENMEQTNSQSVQTLLQTTRGYGSNKDEILLRR